MGNGNREGGPLRMKNTRSITQGPSSRPPTTPRTALTPPHTDSPHTYSHPHTPDQGGQQQVQVFLDGGAEGLQAGESRAHLMGGGGQG